MTSRRHDDAARAIAKLQRRQSEFALKGHRHIPDVPLSVRVRATTDTGIPDNTLTTVSFNLPVENDAAYFQDTNTVVTVLRSGVYRVDAAVVWSTNTTGSRRLFIQAGGNLIGGQSTEALGFPVYQSAAATIRLDAEDEIVVQVHHNAGTTLPISASEGTRRVVTYLGS